MKQLYYCPKKTAFASGIDNNHLMNCFPLGSVLGIADNTIELFGVGTLGLRIKKKDGHYYSLPWNKEGNDLQKEVFDDLKKKLEQHLGKR